MKSRKSILSSVVVLMVAVLVVSCATKTHVPTEDEPLYGTWLNEEYEESTDEGSMRIFYPDGKVMHYGKKSDPEPRWECRFTIEEKWTDQEGNICYKVLSKCGSPPYNESRASSFRMSIKIHPSGDVMESVAYAGTYYQEIRPDDLRYKIHYRQ